jgi:hypothetical protein
MQKAKRLHTQALYRSSKDAMKVPGLSRVLSSGGGRVAAPTDPQQVWFPCISVKRRDCSGSCFSGVRVAGGKGQQERVVEEGKAGWNRGEDVEPLVSSR